MVTPYPYTRGSAGKCPMCGSGNTTSNGCRSCGAAWSTGSHRRVVENRRPRYRDVTVRGVKYRVLDPNVPADTSQ